MHDLPFLGLEQVDPYSRQRVGRIIKIRDTIASLGEGESPEPFLGTATIEWVDWGGVAQAEVPLTYTSFSNPIINPPNQTLQEIPGATLTGVGYGFLHMPSEGDVVVCGFRYDGRPVITGFLAQNYYQQTQSTTKINSGFGSFRRIVSGEYSWKSKQQAEIYLDRKGALRATAKIQPAAATAVPTTDLATLTLGVVYDTTTFTNPEVSAQGQNGAARLRIKNASGTTVADFLLDVAGNVSLTTVGGATLTMASNGGINLTPGSGQSLLLNQGSKGAARVNDRVAMASELTALWNLVLTHVHSGVLSGGATSGPSPQLAGQSVPVYVGEVAEGSTVVQIG